jgi:hypothetical protein
MPTLHEICTAFAPEYLERYPHLPASHRQVLSAIQNCRSGSDGHSLSQCPHCAGQHRIPDHTSSSPSPSRRRSAPSSAHSNTSRTRRCFRRRQRLASGWPTTSASSARTSRGSPGSCIRGVGSSSIIPISTISSLGGLSKDRAPWRPSRAHCFVPVTAPSPLYRALFKAEMR